MVADVPQARRETLKKTHILCTFSFPKTRSKIERTKDVMLRERLEMKNQFIEGMKLEGLAYFFEDFF